MQTFDFVEEDSRLRIETRARVNSCDSIEGRESLPPPPPPPGSRKRSPRIFFPRNLRHGVETVRILFPDVRREKVYLAGSIYPEKEEEEGDSLLS